MSRPGSANADLPSSSSSSSAAASVAASPGTAQSAASEHARLSLPESLTLAARAARAVLSAPPAAPQERRIPSHPGERFPIRPHPSAHQYRWTNEQEIQDLLEMETLMKKNNEKLELENSELRRQLQREQDRVRALERRVRIYETIERLAKELERERETGRLLEERLYELDSVRRREIVGARGGEAVRKREGEVLECSQMDLPD